MREDFSAITGCPHAELVEARMLLDASEPAVPIVFVASRPSWLVVK
jgi:hypothetical protein